jgi:Ser/Thr protein kinase RdoA (MazF antagonist)
MATAHNHTENWQLPEGFTRHAWDIEGILGDEPFWGRFWDLPELTDEQAQLMLTIRELARSELELYGQKSSNYGLIHADFVPENLLVSDATVCLIDFDDCGFSWHLFDIATSLFFYLGQPYYEEARNEFFKGYEKNRQLPAECLELLPLFFLLRGTTYLGWMNTRREIAATHEMLPIIIAMVVEMAEDYL